MRWAVTCLGAMAAARPAAATPRTPRRDTGSWDMFREEIALALAVRPLTRPERAGVVKASAHASMARPVTTAVLVAEGISFVIRVYANTKSLCHA